MTCAACLGAPAVVVLDGVADKWRQDWPKEDLARNKDVPKLHESQSVEANHPGHH